jgi:hypothetical protein
VVAFLFLTYLGLFERRECKIHEWKNYRIPKHMNGKLTPVWNSRIDNTGRRIIIR